MIQVIMRYMKTRKFLGLLPVLFLIGLTACGSPATPSPVSGNGVTLTPYSTETATPTTTPTSLSAPTSTPAPTLTPTPNIITLTGNETFWTLAAKNGLSVAEIEAANPTLNKYSLMAGMKVVIPPPAAGGTQQAPTPTALPVLVHDPVCSPSLTGGLYCFAMVENNQTLMLQSVSGQFTITDSQSGEVQVQPALLPLDHLPVGNDLPLYAYFPPPVASSYQVTLQLFSALPDDGSNSSYLPLTIDTSNVEISSDGLSAAVTGSVSSASAASRFDLAAVAYDSAGNVVAVRQLENKNGLAAGASVDFKLYVYSIAGKIDHVSLFGEAAQPD